MSFDFLYNFVWNISHPRETWATYYLKYFCKVPGYSCKILIKLGFSRQIFEKSSNVKFHENASSGSWIVPLGEADGRTDMMKLTVAFRHIVNLPKNDK
jgi:hypothetical protein